MPRRARLCIGSRVTFLSRNLTARPSGRTTPTTMLNVVVLPAPLGPSRPTTSLALTWMETPLTTRRLRYSFTRFSVLRRRFASTPTCFSASVACIRTFVCRSLISVVAAWYLRTGFEENHGRPSLCPLCLCGLIRDPQMIAKRGSTTEAQRAQRGKERCKGPVWFAALPRWVHRCSSVVRLRFFVGQRQGRFGYLGSRCRPRLSPLPGASPSPSTRLPLARSVL